MVTQTFIVLKETILEYKFIENINVNIINAINEE